MTKDYLAQLKVDPNDKLDHGVKGMKWGVRRDERPLLTKDQALNISQRSQVKLASAISAVATVGITSNAAATLFQLQSRFEHLKIVEAVIQEAQNNPYINEAGRTALKSTKNHIVKGLIGSAIATTAISATIGIVTHRTAKAYFAPIHKVYGDAKGKINGDLKRLGKDLKSGKRGKMSDKEYQKEVSKIVAKHMTKDRSNILSPFHELARSQLGTEYNTKALDIKFEKLPNTELYHKMTVTTPTGLKLVKAIKNVQHSDLDEDGDQFKDWDIYFDYKFDEDGYIDEWSAPTIEITNDLLNNNFNFDAVVSKFGGLNPEGDAVGPTKIGNDQYLAHYGIRGMKWGVSRKRGPKGTVGETADAKSAAAAKSTTGSTAKPSTPDEPKKEVFGAASGESSQDRYSRLATQAKGGGAHQMSEQDLKFFNARTEALAKVNKMNEVKPGWLQTTTKTVIQNAAQKSMQSVANAVTDKYVSGPLVKAIKGLPVDAPAPKGGGKKKKSKK